VVVIDSSVALEWLLGQNRAEEAGRVFRRREDLLVHPLFWLEIANVLTKQVRAAALTSPQRDTAWQALEDLRLTTLSGDIAQSLLPQVLALAEAHRLSAYDAAHLAAALHLGAAFATLDGALSAATVKAGGRFIDWT